MWQTCPISSHAVNARHRTYCYDSFVRPFVAHYAHSRNRQKNWKRLPDGIVEFSQTKFFVKNAISSLNESNLLLSNVSDDAHCEPWTREWVPSQNFSRST